MVFNLSVMGIPFSLHKCWNVTPRKAVMNIIDDGIFSHELDIFFSHHWLGWSIVTILSPLLAQFPYARPLEQPWNGLFEAAVWHDFGRCALRSASRHLFDCIQNPAACLL